MESVQLTDQYPELLEVCRKYDCDFREGVRIIEESRRQGTLSWWVQ
jgi:hypothetical protein